MTGRAGQRSTLPKLRSPDWLALANAAIDARNDLRGVIPIIDRAIEQGGCASDVLRNIRDLASHHADKLRYALKGRGA